MGSAFKRILAEGSHGQLRIGLLDGDTLEELYIERPGQSKRIGAIYRGRVANILPGMQAAFVDIGLDKNAFLYAGDIRSPREFEEPEREVSIKKLVQIGQELLVQVIKEPGGSKGPRVTTHITLPGRRIVLVPTMRSVGISRRIEDETERARLKGILESIKPEDMGIIVRTAALGCVAEDFYEDIEGLHALWQQIKANAELVSAPALVFEDGDLLTRTVRDLFTEAYTALICNDTELYARALATVERYAPMLQERVQLNPCADLFSRYGVEAQAEKALLRRVWLKSGGYLVFDYTEALTVIDVNTGKYVGERDLATTILQINLEAAAEIARQVRLRDLGGIIVIDFIDMVSAEHQASVLEALRIGLRNDRNKTNVVGLTGLGLVEMTRKKMRQPLSALLTKTCGACGGAGWVMSEETVGHRVLGDIDRYFASSGEGANGLLVRTNPRVAEWLREHGEAGGEVWVLPCDVGAEEAAVSPRVEPAPAAAWKMAVAKRKARG